MKQGPRILVLDIETSPKLVYVWDIWNVNVSLNQIVEDWTVLSWAAKWYKDSPKELMYMDTRKEKNVRNDFKVIKGIWKLLNEADFVMTQNGSNFDCKKLNSRFRFYKMKPPRAFKHLDTLVISKKYLGNTSNKLEYMSEKYNVKYKKQKHKKYPGQELWNECLKGNKDAWNHMEKYNKYDVLATEELCEGFLPYLPASLFEPYYEAEKNICTCGNDKFAKNGYKYTAGGKYQRYVCTKCGSEAKDKENLFSKEKKKSLRR